MTTRTDAQTEDEALFPSEETKVGRPHSTVPPNSEENRRASQRDSEIVKAARVVQSVPVSGEETAPGPDEPNGSNATGPDTLPNGRSENATDPEHRTRAAVASDLALTGLTPPNSAGVPSVSEMLDKLDAKSSNIRAYVNHARHSNSKAVGPWFLSFTIFFLVPH